MRHATLVELAERDGIVLPDAAGRGVAAAALGGRREGLVPLPAALRRRAVGAAHRGRRAPAGAGGGRGRRRRRRPVAGDPGRPERVRRPVRRDHRVHRPGARRRPGGLGGDRAGHGGRGRGQPHPAPARRPDPGPARRAVRRPRGGRLRAVQRRAPRRHRGLRGRPSRIAERAGLLLVPHGGELLGPGARPHLPRRPARRTGSATASASAEDPALLERVVAAEVPLEVCPVSNVALGVYTDLTLGAAAAAAGRRGDRRAGRRRPAAVRLPAGGAVRHHARRPRPRRRAASPSWPAMSVRASSAPPALRAQALADIDAWLREPAPDEADTTLGCRHDDHTGGRRPARRTPTERRRTSRAPGSSRPPSRSSSRTAPRRRATAGHRPTGRPATRRWATHRTTPGRRPRWCWASSASWSAG